MASRGARWLWLMLTVALADRATKYFVEKLTTEGYRREILPDIAFLVHSTNPGVAFGLFARSGSGWLSMLLIGTSALTVLFIAGLLVWGRAGGSLNEAGLALIGGGAAGNLYDRVVH